MKTKQVNPSGEAVWAVVMNADDPVIESLSTFARQEKLSAAALTGIGAFSYALLGFFDRATKDYRKIEVNEQTEVLSLLGDIVLCDDEPKLHLHVVLGRADGSTLGGHLLAARVWPTLELIIRESPSHLRRRYDSEAGLPLIDLDA